MTTPDHRPTYTSAQILEYYSHINLPPQHRHAPGTTSRTVALGPSDAALAYLSALQIYTLCAVPFENLDLHYTPHHCNTLDPALIYEKIVTGKRGRGGYCMENNNFFGTVLRALGFDVYPTGGRVNAGMDGGEQEYGGWNHMVNIVTIAEQRYLVDVGFGGAAASTAPLPLVDGLEVVQVEPQTLRLRYTNIPDGTSRRMKMWVFEVRHAPGKPFWPVYCFNAEVEFLPADYRVMNYYTSTSRTSFFTYRLLVTRVVMGRDGRVEALYVLDDKEVKKRVNGVAERVLTCKSEEDRVEALKEYFGIELTDVEKASISGMVSQIS